MIGDIVLFRKETSDELFDRRKNEQNTTFVRFFK